MASKSEKTQRESGERQRHEKVNYDLVGLELLATAHLLRHWSRHWLASEPADEHKRLWTAKITKFREGVITQGSPGRTREIVTHELVNLERGLLQAAVEDFRKGQQLSRAVDEQLKEYATVYIAKPGGPLLRRPLPCPEEDKSKLVKLLSNRETATNEIVEHLLQARFRLTPKTLENLAGRKTRADALSEPTRILASIYLDLSSLNPRNHRVLTVVLNALIEKGCSPILLYYLVQASHWMEPCSGFRPAADAQIQDYCQAVAHGCLQGPFPLPARTSSSLSG